MQNKSAHPIFLFEQSNCSLHVCKCKSSLFVENKPLCVISAGFLRVVVIRHAAAIGLGTFRYLSPHRHSNYFQPALLKFLGLSSKVVGGLGLGDVEACRWVCGPGGVVHRITHQGYGALCFYILRGKSKKRSSSL